MNKSIEECNWCGLETQELKYADPFLEIKVENVSMSGMLEGAKMCRTCWNRYRNLYREYGEEIVSFDRTCLTNGMILNPKIEQGRITIIIDTPNQSWDKTVSMEIYKRLHDGIEYALAPFWKEKKTNEK